MYSKDMPFYQKHSLQVTPKVHAGSFSTNFKGTWWQLGFIESLSIEGKILGLIIVCIMSR